MMKLIVLLLAFSQALVTLAHDQQNESEEISVTDWIFGRHASTHDRQNLREVNVRADPPPPPPPPPFSVPFHGKL